MRYDQLEHAIRAACDVSGDTVVLIFGSQAIDLAASKLVAYREKDRIFVATLLSEKLIMGNILLQRIADLPIDEPLRNRLLSWVRMIVTEIA